MNLVTTVITRPLEIPPGVNRVALVVIAHADDAVLFCGGLIAELAACGYQIQVIRLTDDRWDSWGLDEQATMVRNKTEFDTAMQLLGVTQVHELGYQTDQLGDASETELRDILVSKIREIRPYLVVGFDPDSYLYEDNRDHVVLAEALAEALWCSGFDKHGHSTEGKGAAVSRAPFLPAHKWYFGRIVAEPTHHLDVTKHRKLLEDVIMEHQTMLNNMAHQMRLKAETATIDLNDFEPTDPVHLRLFANYLVDKTRTQGDALVERYRVIDDTDVRQFAAFVARAPNEAEIADARS